MQTANTRHEISTVSNSGAALDVAWCDGHNSVFPSIWLLHACDCAACGSIESAVRHIRLTDQPERPVITGAQVVGNGQ